MSSIPELLLSDQCAACGKGGDDLKSCTACKLVKYCNRSCQQAHRNKHKKACKKRAAELHDEALFATPPPREDCPICFLPLPRLSGSGSLWNSCCGKLICEGCLYGAEVEESKKDAVEVRRVCAFCRDSGGIEEYLDREFKNKKNLEQMKKRMEANDARAFYAMGTSYFLGNYGLSVDLKKAHELWMKAGEMGCDEAYPRLADAYWDGNGVEKDMKRAEKYWELSAMAGNEQARFNLGAVEENRGNIIRAMKHYIIAACQGCDDSLKEVKEGYMKGYVTKEEFANTLRMHKDSHDGMKSDNRTKAAEIRTLAENEGIPG